MTAKDRIPVCPHKTKDDISPYLISALERLERHLGKELSFSSGVRCKDCNAKVGGAPNSAHLRGMAVDIPCHDSHTRFEIVSCIIVLDWRRIEVTKAHVHLDVDSSLPQDVLIVG